MASTSLACSNVLDWISCDRAVRARLRDLTLLLLFVGFLCDQVSWKSGGEMGHFLLLHLVWLIKWILVYYNINLYICIDFIIIKPWPSHNFNEIISFKFSTHNLFAYIRCNFMLRKNIEFIFVMTKMNYINANFLRFIKYIDIIKSIKYLKYIILETSI